MVGVLFMMNSPTFNKSQQEMIIIEDSLRQLLGMHAFVLLSYEKAVNNIFRQMSNLRSEKLSRESWKLFKKYEDSPVAYREEVYYNDFLRLIVQGNEPDMLIRLGKYFLVTNIAFCPQTGIITAHGFSFEPFTTNIALFRALKYYRRGYVKENHQVGNANSGRPSKMVFESKPLRLGKAINEANIDNLKIPFSKVYL